MSGSSWATAALLLLHLVGGGALPKEVPSSGVAGYASGQQLVRVLISSQAAALSLRAETGATIEDPETGAARGEVKAGAPLAVRVSGRGVSALGATHARLRFRPHGSGASTLTGRSGRFPGVLDISASGGQLLVVEETALESYLTGVVAAELPKSFPLQAAEAQAIAARTYTLFHLGDHAAEGADLCGEVHCQAYTGVPASTSLAARAVRQTAGEVLTWHGVLVDAMYHAACGGSTATAWETRQGKLLPYLVGVSDEGEAGPYCARGHTVSWSKRFSAREAQQLVSRNLGTVLGEPGLRPGRLQELDIDSREQDRVKWFDVRTDTGTYRVFGDSVRWLFGTGVAGPSGLRSTRFELTVERDAQGRPRAYVFRGVGHGHGLGLCQWGARGRALAGQGAAQILTAYYPGTELTDLRNVAVSRLP